MTKLLKKGSNETTVGTTTMGAGIAVVLVVLAGQFGLVELSSEASAILVGGFTPIFNYFIPAKKKG